MSVPGELESYIYPQIIFSDANGGICACCLSQETKLIHLDSCRHKTIFSLIPNFQINSNIKHVCPLCHSLLSKFSQFYQQVVESIHWLNTQATQLESNRKTIDLQRTEISVSSVLCSESSCTNGPVIVVKEEDVKVENNVNIKQETIESDPEYDIPLLQIKEEKPETKSKVKVKVKVKREDNVKKKKKVQRKVEVKVQVKKEKLHKRPNFKDKIRRVTLTEEEFQQERERDRTNQSYIGMNYKCSDCVVGFNYEDALQVHMKSRHLIKPDIYTCSICKTVLSNERRLTAHRNSHYKRFECRECGHMSRRLISAKSHYSRNHGVLDVRDTFPCVKCDFVADSYNAYQTHLERHNECKVCNKLFPTQSKLKQHQLAVHEKVKKYECKICNKQFGFQNALNSHELNVHGTQKAAYCVECDKYYKSELTLRAHYLTHRNHISLDDKKYVCEHCNERFLTKRLLEDHIPFKHFPTTLPKCDICNKRLATQRYLERHIDFVHNKKRLPKSKICNFCGKGFTSTEKLNIHMRVHTGERPLACPMCPAMFAHPSALYTHKKLIHKTKGAKPEPASSNAPNPPTFDPTYFYG